MSQIGERVKGNRITLDSQGASNMYNRCKSLFSPITTVSLGAHALLEDIGRVLIKIISVVVNLNKATHILKLQVNS